MLNSSSSPFSSTTSSSSPEDHAVVGRPRRDNTSGAGGGSSSPSSSSSSWMYTCQKILNHLFQRDQEGWFTSPVDPIAMEIPDYVEIIKEPMDLGTVQENLTGKKYAQHEDFAKDVRLIFRNAMTYNESPDHAVHQAAAALTKDFDEQWGRRFGNKQQQQQAKCTTSSAAPSHAFFAKRTRASVEDLTR